MEFCIKESKFTEEQISGSPRKSRTTRRSPRCAAGTASAMLGVLRLEEQIRGHTGVAARAPEGHRGRASRAQACIYVDMALEHHAL